MSAQDSFADIKTPDIGVALPGRRRCRRGRSGRRRRTPLPITDESAVNDCGSSLGFSDSDDRSSAHLDSSVESSGMFSYNHSHRVSLSEEIDLEIGELEAKVHSLGSYEKQCRICHLKFAGGDDDDEVAEAEDGGDGIELGCNCKGDLGTAHRKCAVTWFTIKGDLTCEICGAIAQNIGIEQMNETNNDVEIRIHELTEPIFEGQSSLNGRRFVNVLLACMVLAFVISWLFHFNVLR